MFDMEETKFAPQPGDAVYTSDGYKARYVSSLGTKHFVQVAQSWEDDEFYDQVIEVKFVFPSAPTEVLDAKYAAKLAKLEEIEQEIAQLRAEAVEESKSRQARQKIFAKFAVLDNLEAFIEGKITHFVDRQHGRIEIKTFHEVCIETNDQYRANGDVRLLSLFGRSNGDLCWKINQYCDGSGSYHEVFPCLSFEDAKEKAIQFFGELCVTARSEKARQYDISNVIQSAKAIGIVAPDDIYHAWIAETINGTAKRVEELKSQLALAEVAHAESLGQKESQTA